VAEAGPAAKQNGAVMERGAATISDSARARAVAMRRYDARLTDAQIDAIARGIDDAAAAGTLLDSAAAPLANGDEPVTRFAVSEKKARA
jgi:hypothetical protein